MKAQWLMALLAAVAGGAEGPAGPAGESGASFPLPGSGCSDGDLLSWNGVQWTCAPDARDNTVFGVDAVSAAPGSGLVASGTNTVTLRLIDCASGETPHFSGSAWECETDHDLPVPPASVSGHLQLTNTTAGTNAGALAVENTTAGTYALTATNTSTGPALSVSADSSIARSQLHIRDLGSVRSGVTLQNTSATQRFAVGATFGANARLELTYNEATLLSVGIDDRTSVDSIALGANTFNGGSNGSYVVTHTSAVSTPSCTSLCTTSGFTGCSGYWRVSGASPAAGVDCASSGTLGSTLMCFCTN